MDQFTSRIFYGFKPKIILIVCHFGEFCNVTQLFEKSCVTVENSLIFCDKSAGVGIASFDQAGMGSVSRASIEFT